IPEHQNIYAGIMGRSIAPGLLSRPLKLGRKCILRYNLLRVQLVHDHCERIDGAVDGPHQKGAVTGIFGHMTHAPHTTENFRPYRASIGFVGQRMSDLGIVLGRNDLECLPLINVVEANPSSPDESTWRER